MMQIRTLLFFTVASATLGVSLLLCANPAVANSALFARPVTIQGFAPSDIDLARAEERLGNARVTLNVHGGPSETVRLADTGISLDRERSLGAAERASKEGIVEHVSRFLRGDHSPREVPLSFRVDEARFNAWVEPFKERYDVPPLSARLDVDNHKTVKEKDGAYIDADQLKEELVALAIRDATSGAQPLFIDVQPVPFKPRLTEAFIGTIDVSAVVGEYETYFSRRGDQAARGQNIDAAATRLNGVVLMPNELFSFNGVVGQRSEENGFQKSWEIFKGEMVEGIGGGTCQVASTFHAAAFFGGLDVLERLPHSRPSAYIPMGLDSTVVYPAVDLKIKNPHPFPIVIHASALATGKLRVELLGASRPVRVEFAREVVERIPFKRKLVEKEWLGGNRIVRKQHGIFGYKIKRLRTIHYADGTEKKEEEKGTYPPTAEVFEVPPGFDESRLPALPEIDEEAVGEGGDLAAATAKTAEEAARNSEALEAAGLTVTEAKGVHAPTAAQRMPQKTVSMHR